MCYARFSVSSGSVFSEKHLGAMPVGDFDPRTAGKAIFRRPAKDSGGSGQ
jgi:hypothetical protein